MSARAEAPTLVGADRYRPGLDGLRAVAVVAVVLFHAGATSGLPGVAPGGFLGVSVFFTLSGYLVTTLLISSPLDLGRFWTRRLKRLVPASLLVVLVSVAVARWFWSGMLPGDAIAATYGVTNWYVIVSGSDELLRTIVGPLGPYWSLAVEEQFYAFMAVAVALTARARRPLRALAIVVAVGWAASALVQLFADWPAYRLEFGTDARAAELFSGCALAILLHRHPDLLERCGRWLAPLGVVGFAIVVGLAATTDYDPPWLLHGGYAALSIVNAVVVMSLLVAGPLTRALSVSSLVTVGRASYSWYLVHWPVILLLSPERTGLDGWGLLVIKVVASFGVGIALHVGVEQPLRRAEPPRRTIFVAWITATLAVSAVALALL
jgi:peptidoglycan/LPS O-acetylase OafA/YrhL